MCELGGESGGGRAMKSVVRAHLASFFGVQGFSGEVSVSGGSCLDLRTALKFSPRR